MLYNFHETGYWKDYYKFSYIQTLVVPNVVEQVTANIYDDEKV